MLFKLRACLSFYVACAMLVVLLRRARLTVMTGQILRLYTSAVSTPSSWSPPGICLTGYSCLTANGCQNGCTDAASSSAAPNQPANPTSASVVTQLVTSSQEPILGSPTSNAAAPTGKVTTDGSCGAGNGNTICGNWPQGSCCSMYGVCTIPSTILGTILTPESIVVAPRAIVEKAARVVRAWDQS